jgi:hypothetical protein
MPYSVEIQLPADFVRLNSIQPAPILGADGYWYILIYGRPKADTQYHQHIFRWKPGSPAELVTMPTTDARGSIGAHDRGGALFAWDGSGMYPRLLCIELPGFVPAEAARLTALEQRVKAIENAAGLSADDRAALDDLKRMLAAVRG